MSKRIDLGPVLPIHKGEWKSGTTYERLNTVRHKSASWVCKAVTTIDEPTTSSPDWFLQSEDSNGVASVNGQTGVVTITSTLSTPALTDDSTLLTNTAWVNDRIEQTVDSINSTITSTAEETLAEATSFTTTAISEAMTDADANNSKTFATKTELDVVRANLVDISTNQTIGGTKIFSQPIEGSITGTAASADKASKDALGNIIDTTYASKTELATTIQNTSNTILETVTNNYLNKTDAAATYITPTAVDTKIANVVASAPANLNTLAKLATAVTTNQTNIGTLTTAVDSKADVDDVVTLTGTQSITGAKTFASTITGSVSGNAGTATKFANSVNFEGVVFDGSKNVDRYAQTSDDGTKAAKTVTLNSSFELAHGAEITIIVGQNDTSTTGNLTLNVNNTGAKPITYKNKAFDRTYWKQSEIFKFVYDGTSWRFVGQLDTNTTYTAATATPKVAGTATVGISANYAREDHVHPVQTSVTGSSGSCTGNAATATKATQDGNGNNIALTYATKTELNNKTSVNNATKWDGATKYVLTKAPTSSDGANGDIWFQYA